MYPPNQPLLHNQLQCLQQLNLRLRFNNLKSQRHLSLHGAKRQAQENPNGTSLQPNWSLHGIKPQVSLPLMINLSNNCAKPSRPVFSLASYVKEERSGAIECSPATIARGPMFHAYPVNRPPSGNVGHHTKRSRKSWLP